MRSRFALVNTLPTPAYTFQVSSPFRKDAPGRLAGREFDGISLGRKRAITLSFGHPDALALSNLKVGDLIELHEFDIGSQGSLHRSQLAVIAPDHHGRAGYQINGEMIQMPNVLKRWEELEGHNRRVLLNMLKHQDGKPAWMIQFKPLPLVTYSVEALYKSKSSLEVFRTLVRRNPQLVFLYGGLPEENVTGNLQNILRRFSALNLPVPTKPNQLILSDADYPRVTPAIAQAVDRARQLLQQGKTLYLPTYRGQFYFGTGAINLPQIAPNINAFIQSALVGLYRAFLPSE